MPFTTVNNAEDAKSDGLGASKQVSKLSKKIEKFALKFIFKTIFLHAKLVTLQQNQT